MKGIASIRLVALVFVGVFMAGCAGRAPQSGPGPLNIGHFTLAQGALGVHYQQALLASGGLKPYSWAVIDGSLPPGLSLSLDGAISGTVDCGAPTPPCPNLDGQHSKTFTFTVAVSDSQQPTQAVDMRSESITINQDLTLSAPSLPDGIVDLPYDATFMAADGVAPYSYTVAGDMPLPDGLTLNTIAPQMGMPNAAQITGTPTTAGLYSFTIQATDSAQETATAVFTIRVRGRIDGNYVMTFNGFNAGVPFYLIGQLVADGNGNFTSGTLDQIGPGATATTNVPLTASTYDLPSGTNFGSLTLNSSLGTYKFNIAVAASGDSKIVLSDPDHPDVYGSGLLKKQAATAISIGSGSNVSYSFGVFGNDVTGDRYAGAGMFQLNSSLAIVGGAEDTNDNGTASGELAITGGALTPDPPPPPPAQSTGRGTATVTVNGDTYDYVYYVVSMNELVAIATDIDTHPATLLDIQQQLSAGPLSGGLVICKHDTSCQATLDLDGVTNDGMVTPEAEVGVISFVASSDGNMGTIMRTDGIPAYHTNRSTGGSLSTVAFNTGSYSIDATCGPIMIHCGRVTLTVDGYDTPPVLYLFNSSQGFVVGSDPLASQGMMLPQSGMPFTQASIFGSYLGGTISPTTSTITNEAVVASTPPPGNVWKETFDSSGPGGPLTGQTLQCTPGTDGCPFRIDGTFGAALGKFEIINNNGDVISIFYLTGGGGASGTTGGKTGIVGINVGILGSDGSVAQDPNPRVSTYSR